jgi:hypothetical protein
MELLPQVLSAWSRRLVPNNGEPVVVADGLVVDHRSVEAWCAHASPNIFGVGVGRIVWQNRLFAGAPFPKLLHYGSSHYLLDS